MDNIWASLLLQHSLTHCDWYNGWISPRRSKPARLSFFDIAADSPGSWTPCHSAHNDSLYLFIGWNSEKQSQAFVRGVLVKSTGSQAGVAMGVTTLRIGKQGGVMSGNDLRSSWGFTERFPGGKMVTGSGYLGVSGTFPRCTFQSILQTTRKEAS